MALLPEGISLEVQQFRPPVDSCTAELPAGLIDKGETAEEAIGTLVMGKIMGKTIWNIGN